MKKIEAKKEECCSFRERGARGLYFLGAVFFGALGFASILQGILLQVSLGFTYGLFAYILGLLFIGIAKYMKWKVYGICMPMMHR
ncbi:MAG: hypothetical protein PHO02_04520 [Candidatus Nanoarchaeia archaeon]|nr:hypothetical protein [Candidatus Nanoarchaeia archaeon]